MALNFWDVEVLDDGRYYSWNEEENTGAIQENLANLQLFEIEEGEENKWVNGQGEEEELLALSEDEGDIKAVDIKKYDEYV